MREQVIEKIKTVFADEQLRLDAYFLCGFPTDTPDDKLVKICKQFLAAEEAGEDNKELAAELVAAFEANLAREKTVADKDNIIGNDSNLQFVVDNKDAIL